MIHWIARSTRIRIYEGILCYHHPWRNSPATSSSNRRRTFGLLGCTTRNIVSSQEIKIIETNQQQCGKEAFRQVLEQCAPSETATLQEPYTKKLKDGPLQKISSNGIIKRSSTFKLKVWYANDTKNNKEDYDLSTPDLLRNHYLVVRSCHLSSNDAMARSIHTGMHVAFLGTSAGQPTTTRNAPAAALRFGGKTFLFDAGEGVHRQMQFSTLSSNEISKIFITHMHGDHIFGLPSMLLELSVKQKVQITQQLAAGSKNYHLSKKKTIEIYGPPGLYNYICMNLVLSCSKFDTLNIIVHELVGGKTEVGPYHQIRQRNNNMLKNPFTEHYCEFANCLPTIERRLIPMGPDGTWTIEQPPTVTEEMVWNRCDLINKKNQGLYVGKIPRLPNDLNAGPGKQMLIKASEVKHMPGIPTFGYVIEEIPPPLKIDPKKAMMLGLSPSPKYDILKNGFSVKSDDGLNIIHPDQVILDSRQIGRKFALLGDNHFVPTPMAKLCQNADVVVHEATFLMSEKEKSFHGHSTAEMAGKFALDVRAKVLVLNHFGAAIGGDEALDMVIAQARKGNKGTSHIITSQDFMEVLVPISQF